MDQTLELSRLWERIWARRVFIVGLALAVTLLTAAVAFLLPPWYRADASLLPPTEEESGFGLVSLLRGVALPGVKLPTQATLADVFLAILESRRLNEQIVARFDLKKLYGKRYLQDAVKELHRHARFSLSEAGTIEIAVEDRDPQRAARMANAYVELLDRFNREVRMTKGRRTRLFVEGRLAETRRDLAIAEQKYADYQSTHKAIALTPELSTAVETAARLYAQRAALQVRLGVVRSYTRGRTDEELQLVQQLSQLDRQLISLPETGVEMARLLREVKTLDQLNILLTAQYEEARITEARDVTTVEPLDIASTPERKWRPKRMMMMMVALLVSLAAGIAFALLPREERSESVAGYPAAG